MANTKDFVVKNGLTSGGTITGPVSGSWTLGAEQLTLQADRDFSGPGNWTDDGAGSWYIDTGKYWCIDQVESVAYNAAFFSEIGQAYQITLDITTTIAGSFAIATNYTYVSYPLTVGTVSKTFNFVGDGQPFYINGAALWAGAIDNVTVKIIVPAVPAFRAGDETSVLTLSSNLIRTIHIGRGAGGGSDSISIGAFASFADGSSNIAIGGQALFYSTGMSNIAIGYGTMHQNTLGNNNVAIGWECLTRNTTGSNNIAIFGLANNTTGSDNIAIGRFASGNSIAVSNSVAIGYNALSQNQTASGCTAIGFSALQSVTGQNNTAVGYYALANLASAQTGNTAIGTSAGRYHTSTTILTSASSSTFIGYQTRASANGPSNETVIGALAVGMGSNTVTLGSILVTALYPPQSYISRIANGASAVGHIFNTVSYTTAGAKLVSFQNATVEKAYIDKDGQFNGVRIWTDILWGNGDMAIGLSALGNRVSGTGNLAIGYSAMGGLNTGNSNTAIGESALAANTGGGNNLAIGAASLVANLTGYSNIGVGGASLSGNVGGHDNIGIGASTLLTNASGNFNLAIGYLALGGMDASSNNIGIGEQAGVWYGTFEGNVLALATNSIYIGNRTLAKLDNPTNEIVIGSGALGNGSNTITLGNTSVTGVFTSGLITSGGSPVSRKVAVPATAGAAGSIGDWAADASWLYICTALNTWQRTAITLATW